MSNELATGWVQDRCKNKALSVNTFNFRKIFSRFRKSLAAVTFCAALLLMLVLLPWLGFLDSSQDRLILGLPLPYFMVLLAAPFIGVAVLLVYLNASADIDRHTLEFENE
ncbi:MAG: hypothetical protein AAF478_09815 [Pseudomonadota bacterium]